MRVGFVSDVHLIDDEDPRTLRFLHFLRTKAAEYDTLHIVGDLFDVWPGTTDYLIQRFTDVLRSLQALTASGTRVCYIEGNHDFRLGKTFLDLGIEVYPDSMETELGNRRVYLTHGHVSNPNEKSSVLLRNLLRSNALHSFLRFLPERTLYKLGDLASNTSRNAKPALTETRAQAIRETYRKSSEALCALGYEVVIMGHTHLPDDYHFQIENRSCRYINTGDWVSNFTYVEFDGNEFYTKSYCDSII